MSDFTAMQPNSNTPVSLSRWMSDNRYTFVSRRH
jgi:hypothetical protein